MILCTGPCGRTLDPDQFYSQRRVCKACYNSGGKSTGDRDPRAAPETGIRARVRDVLASDTTRTWTTEQVAIAIGESTGKVGDVMKRLCDLAELTRVSRGAYVVVDVSKRRRRQLGQVEEAPTTRWPNVAAFDTSETDSVGGEAPEETAAQRKERERAEAQLARDEAAAAAAARRRASDFAALKPEDMTADEEYDVSVGNVGGQRNAKISADASREKRQEFNEKMGEFATDFRDAAAAAHQNGGKIAVSLPAHHADYIRNLAEQERRFGNRRWSRSIAIAEAHEQLSREAMMHVAETYFRDKVEPVGYARFSRPDTQPRRTACVLLSDLHFGAELDSLDEPYSYTAVQEARRLEYVLRQFVDYKPQYRDHTEALVMINGDVIEGQLMHDFRSGAPLAEQKAIFWRYMKPFVTTVAEMFPSARIVMQPGNHGRDKVRHPGRATARKWDGHEWEMYWALREMCSGLKNVTWSVPFRAVSVIDLYGSTLGLSHADTEVKLGDPDTKARENRASLDKINASGVYRRADGSPVSFDAWAFGHYHKGRYQPGKPAIMWNGPLVPPNGHARGAGYLGDPCGQWIWESVEGFPIGDARFIQVGPSQDNDERLGTLIEPFRFSMFDKELLNQ